MKREEINKKFEELIRIISTVNDRVSLNADAITQLMKLIDKAEKAPDFSDRRKPGETLH